MDNRKKLETFFKKHFEGKSIMLLVWTIEDENISLETMTNEPCAHCELIALRAAAEVVISRETEGQCQTTH